MSCSILLTILSWSINSSNCHSSLWFPTSTLVERHLMVTVPNVLGLSVDEVKKRLGAVGLNVKVSGGGIDQSGCLSSSQSVAPGESVAEGSVVEVVFLSKDAVE